MEYFLTKEGLLGIEFYYKESCSHVYKYFEVRLNGEKKNIRTARKLLNGFEENEPSILTANCYYWHPGGSSANRRYNEKRRYEEFEEFVETLKAKNKYIKLPYVLYENSHYIIKIEERMIIVYNKRIKKEVYHFALLKKYFEENCNYEKIIEEAKRKRYEQIQKERQDIKVKVNLIEIAKKIYVNEQDSIKAGNCIAMTEQVAKQIRNKFSRPIKAVRGDWLLKFRNDEFTRRIIIYKARQLNLI